MSSLRQSGSPLPPEILGIIFSYLERKSDLLNSRLVCRSWNKECLRAMKKPECGFYQTLTESNINQYIDFLHNGNFSSELISLPFHLNINLNILNSEDRGRQCYKTKLNKLTSNVNSLCANLDEECVVKFILKTHPKEYSEESENYKSIIDSTKLWLIELLAIISPGLNILDLSDFNMHLGLYTEIEINSTELCDLKFPKLMTLICSKSKFPPGEFQYPIFNEIYPTETAYPISPFIIARSPNLENLEGINIPDLIALGVNYDKLKTLLIDEIIEEPTRILQKFLQSNSLKLRIFAFSLEYNYYFRPDGRIPIFHRILESVSSTLNSLYVTTKAVESSSYFHGRITSRTAPLMTFPRLSNLQHLRINVNMSKITEYSEDCIFYDPEINFNPETLPSLKSVELPLGFIFCSQSDRLVCLKKEFEVPVNFPAVTELTIRIQRWGVRRSRQSRTAGSLEHLQKVFPNVSKLSIVNESMGVQEQIGVIHVFQSLIRSPLSTDIQEIYIDGFHEDFLGQALCHWDTILLGERERENYFEVVDVWERVDNSFYLKNIRQITLKLSEVSHAIYGNGSHDPFPYSNVSDPNLTAMAKYFPSLKIIEISKLLFRGMTDTEQKDLLQSVGTAFPYLWVRRY